MGNERVREELNMMFSSGRWFMLPKPLLLILPLDEAMLLAFLISKGDQHEAHRNDGWFFCKMELILEELCISRHQHTRLFRCLEKKGFIETKTAKTMPPVRHIRIVPETILEKLGKKWMEREAKGA